LHQYGIAAPFRTAQLKQIKETKKMKIKFSVSYRYVPAAPENERFKAELTVFLPKEEGGKHIPPCYLGKIGYYDIEYDSGLDRGNLREIGIYFYADSLENLDKTIESAIEDYRKQVIKNIEIIPKIKENREIIVDFPDPIKEGKGYIEELPIRYEE